MARFRAGGPNACEPASQTHLGDLAREDEAKDQGPRRSGRSSGGEGLIMRSSRARHFETKRLPPLIFRVARIEQREKAFDDGIPADFVALRIAAGGLAQLSVLDR